ncbi:MAG: glycosyltransferase [Flavobacterium sp.]|nr:MAG: glycosyltransferase [Flavobacterium sp.]
MLNQTELPYEIVIIDDNSNDGNWDIISDYQAQYPAIIKAYRNEINLGLFENAAKIRTIYTGNVASLCSGDDLLEPDTVKSVNDKIRVENLDADIDKFIIITNSVHLYPDGSKTVWDNYQERFIPAIKTRLRYGLSYRGVGLSRALMESVMTEKEYLEMNSEVGLNADFFKGFEEIINAEKLFYVNSVGGVYRLDVGVTSVEKTNKKWIGHQAAYRAVRERYFKYFDKKDFLFIDFIVSGDDFKLKPSFSTWFKTLYYYIRNLGNFSYNNPAIRNLHYLLPTSSIDYLKFKLYPVYLRLRQNKKH